MHLGNPPGRVTVVMRLTRLNRIIEHDSANLTVTVEAGATLGAVNDYVGRERQFLAFDPPRASQATVGGTIAVNLNGPRRSAYGSVRDLVIGMRAALVSGEHIKAGGKVVKNVAGYDMCKLFVGSLGTLGIITEATLRMTPAPETGATLRAAGPWLKVLQAADAIVSSQLNPTAIFLLRRGAELNSSDSGWELAVGCEGFDGSVRRHLRDVQILAEFHHLAVTDADHESYWEYLREFPLMRGASVYRIVVPRGAIGSVLNRCELRGNQIAVDVLSGIVWIRETETASAQRFSDWSDLAREHSGHAILIAAPPRAKQGLDVWGPAPESLFLMREMKRQFDPDGLLNGGRFVGGL